MYKRFLSLFLVFAMVLSFVPAVSADTTGTADSNLIASFDFSEIKDGKVVDVSGNGNDAAIKGNVVTAGGLGVFQGGYLQLPDNIMSGLDAMTVAGWLNFSDEKAGTQEIFNTRFFDFGKDTDNYFNFGPNTAWGVQVAEVKVNGTLNTAQYGTNSGPWTTFSFAAPGTWAHVAVTLGDGAMKVYINGTEVASGATSFTPASLGETDQNYIGKSQWPDPHFLGMMENVEVYDTVLTAAQITARMNAASQTEANGTVVKQLSKAVAAIDLGDLTSVSTDLPLPASGEDDVAFAWSSGNTELLGNDGKISENLNGTHNVTLTVTASIAGSDITITKDFAVTLVGMTDADIVAYDKENLGLATLVDVDKLTLPTTGKKGSTITWETSDDSVIEADGTVHRPASGAGNAYATLTATITYGEASDTKVFADRMVMEEYTAYLLTYFGGEELKTNSEPTYATVHFAISYDGLHWSPLNDNKTIVAATIKGQDDPSYGQDRADVSLARDPVVYREQDGSFRLLSSHSWNNFDIYVWDKGDLTSFTGERILKVRSTGNAWAPEVVYDAVKEMNLIISTDPGSGDNCGWGCYTTDFTKEDIAEIGMWDVPMMYNVKNGRGYIDCSVYQYDGKYYMTYSSSYSPPRIWISSADSLEEDAFTPIGQVTLDSNPFAEGPFIIKDNTRERWYCYYDYPLNGGIFGCSYTDDLDSGVWTQMDYSEYAMPYGVRHGNAISITAGEAQKLMDTYGIDISITRLDVPESMKVDGGTTFAQLNLPATLKGMSSVGEALEFPVVWDESAYSAEDGRYVINGTVTIEDETLSNADEYKTVSVTVKVGATSNVVAQYEFTEVKDGKIADISGNGNDAVIVGDVTADNGKGSFNGGYLQLPEGVIYGLEEVTVAGWINFSDEYVGTKKMYDTRFFDFGSGTDNYFNMGLNTAWSLQLSEVKVNGTLVEAGYGTKTSDPWTKFTFAAPGTWAHVAVTFGNGHLIVYIDGQEVANTETSYKPSDLGNTHQNYIGKSQWPADPNFPGQMDDVVIYDEVLTADAVAALMNDTAPKSVTGVKLDKAEAVIDVKQVTQLQLNATVEPNVADDLRVTWESSDKAVATVDENGLVTAVSDGDAVITVTTTDGGFTAECKVTVKNVAVVQAQAAQVAAEEARNAAEAAQAKAEEAKDSAVTAQEAAEKAKTDAENAKIAAEEAKTAAEEAENAAKEAAENAGEDAEAAETAKAAAETAKALAETAQGKAEKAEAEAVIAQEAAEAAKSEAEAAQTAAETAQDKAEAAAEAAEENNVAAAQEAAKAASEAAKAATESGKAASEAAKAAKSASEAVASASAAAKSAEESAGYASNAAKSASDAQVAQKAAEDAKAAAEAAQKAAEEEKAAAEEAKGDAEAAQAAAEAAQAAADAAQAAAEAEKMAAQAAKKAAEDAQTAAEAAQKAAEEDQLNAEAAEEAAAAAQAAAEAAQKAAEAEKLAAEKAQKAAEEAEVTAEAAQKAAEEAQAKAEAAQKAAEEEKLAAEEAQKAAEEERKAAEAAKKAAEEAALNGAKYQAALNLDTYAQQVDQTGYDAEQIEAFAAIVSDAKAAIADAESIDEVQELLDEAKAAVDAVEDLCSSNAYTDVAKDAWYHEYVDFMVENGYMNGVSDTLFDVKGSVTRAQLVTILYRTAGEPSVEGMENPFADVADGKWYTDAIIWAADEGIVKGVTETEFAPDAKITREQIVTILYRYDGEEEVEEDQLADFTDADKISNYAKAAMNWAIAKGIVNGVTETTLEPGATATRAQICAIVMRMCEK